MSLSSSLIVTRVEMEMEHLQKCELSKNVVFRK